MQNQLLQEKPPQKLATQKQLKLLAILDDKFFDSEPTMKDYYLKKHSAVSRKDLTKEQASAEIDIRNNQTEKPAPMEKPAEIVNPENHNGNFLPALSGDNLMKIVSSKIALEVIAEQSKDGKGEGILYHNLPGIGETPTADLITMLVSQSQLNTKMTILESGLKELIVGEHTRLVWHTKVRVEDMGTGKSEEAEIHEPAKMTEAWIKGKPYTTRGGKEISVDRLVEDRMSITKARRNAEVRLLGIPTSILPEMVKKMMELYGASVKG